MMASELPLFRVVKAAALIWSEETAKGADTFTDQPFGCGRPPDEQTKESRASVVPGSWGAPFAPKGRDG